MSKPYEVIIFDWDGTLMDSEDTIITCMKAAIQQVGLPEKSSEDIAHIIGLGLREAIVALYPEVNKTQVQSLFDAYRTAFLSNNNATSLFDGTRDVLDALKAQGYYLCVATGKSRAGLDKCMRASQTENYFAITRCADETHSKPDPLMLEEILTDLNTTPDKALMIGDSIYDMEMASHIKMDVVAVTYGVHTRKQLEQYSPLAYLDDITQLIPFLEST